LYLMCTRKSHCSDKLRQNRGAEKVDISWFLPVLPELAVDLISCLRAVCSANVGFASCVIYYVNITEYFRRLL